MIPLPFTEYNSFRQTVLAEIKRLQSRAMGDLPRQRPGGLTFTSSNLRFWACSSHSLGTHQHIDRGRNLCCWTTEYASTPTIILKTVVNLNLSPYRLSGLTSTARVELAGTACHHGNVRIVPLVECVSTIPLKSAMQERWHFVRPPRSPCYPKRMFWLYRLQLASRLSETFLQFGFGCLRPISVDETGRADETILND